MTSPRSHCGGPGSKYSEIATTWSNVLTLPPRLAGITPRRMTQNRNTVTAISLTRITQVTHHGSQPRKDMVTSAAPVSALSAIGSAILPKSVINPRLRAILPSSRSVTEARPNAKNAATRQAGPPASRQTTTTGTSAMRTTVRALAILTSPGAGAVGAATPCDDGSISADTGAPPD